MVTVTVHAHAVAAALRVRSKSTKSVFCQLLSVAYENVASHTLCLLKLVKIEAFWRLHNNDKDILVDCLIITIF